MNRKETTQFLSELLERQYFSGIGKYWAKEVSVDIGTAKGKPRRVDYMQFIPQTSALCLLSRKEYLLATKLKAVKKMFTAEMA